MSGGEASYSREHATEHGLPPCHPFDQAAALNRLEEENRSLRWRVNELEAAHLGRLVRQQGEPFGTEPA